MLRALARLFRVALHLGRGTLTVALTFPHRSEAQRQQLKRQWSARLLHLLGIELVLRGERPAAGLLVSNHISFVDVFAINAMVPASFVAKDEVRSWPLIGWLCRHTDTLFLERGSRAAAQRAREVMVEQLRAGKHVAVFPEGTTSLGDEVLPFHSAMFQGAIDAGVAVTPIAVAYHDARGARSHATAFVGDTTLLQCLWTIAGARAITASVTVLPAHDSSGMERRHLSAHVHRAISHALSHPHRARAMPDTAAGIPCDPPAAPR